jgi:competence protein ComEC
VVQVVARWRDADGDNRLCRRSGDSANDEGRDFTLMGTIDNLPYRFDRGVRFNFAVERVIGGGQGRVPPHVALSWYAGFRDQVTEVGDVQPGERWRLTVRLQRPHGNANPYGFDYEAWLLEQGVRATGYVRADAGNRGWTPSSSAFGNVVERAAPHCAHASWPRCRTGLMPA